MTSTLDQDLTAAGFIPVPNAIDGVVAWTGWNAPAADVYETYYALIKDAMCAELDNPPWRRLYAIHSYAIYRRMMDEYRAVVDCWRSASQVPPAEAR